MTANNSGSELFSLYKKNYKRKQRMFNALNILYTFILIPLLRFLYGDDYSLFWRVMAGISGAVLFINNIRQSRSMKRQLEALSENAAEKISAELEACECFRKNLYFTSEYLFSTEGMVLPYYEIEEIITRSYICSPTITNILLKTRSFGGCVIPVGTGYFNESFYDLLSRKCSNAELKFRVNYQKADMEEYFNTLRAESIIVIRNKQGGNI